MAIDHYRGISKGCMVADRLLATPQSQMYCGQTSWTLYTWTPIFYTSGHADSPCHRSYPFSFGDANEYQKIPVGSGLLEREGHDPVEIEVKSSTLISSYLTIIRAHTLEIKAKQRGLASSPAYERHWVKTMANTVGTKYSSGVRD